MLPNVPKPRTKWTRKTERIRGKEDEDGRDVEVKRRFPTSSVGRVSVGLRPRSRILVGDRHLVLLRIRCSPVRCPATPLHKLRKGR